MVDQASLAAYQRVAADLREKIAAGELRVGSAVPSTSQLCEQYSVSATVVKQAVQQLKTEGLLLGQSGKGVFVVATPEEVAEETATLSSVVEAIDDLVTRVERVERQQTDSAEFTELTTAVRDLRRHLGRVETRLIELYGRLGQPYPHELQYDEDDRETKGRESAG